MMTLEQLREPSLLEAVVEALLVGAATEVLVGNRSSAVVRTYAGHAALVVDLYQWRRWLEELRA